jgi:fatty-acyl-CoA synthase
MRITAGLRAREANHQPLTPVTFLWRAAAAHPDKTAVIERERRLSYRELEHYTRRMAGMLEGLGVAQGDIVSVLAPSSIVMLAAHFAVPMIGAALNTINTRLDAQTIAYILGHAESRLLIADTAHRGTVNRALQLLDGRCQVIWLNAQAPADSVNEPDFETLMSAAVPASTERICDEWQPICVNYTSGTTGQPKGVVYHHRGAYLNSIGNVLGLSFSTDCVYLWVVPMFHCNGWMHAWAVTAAAGTHICLDRVDPAEILRSLLEYRVTHLACAPVVLYMLVNHPDFAKLKRTHTIKIATGGAAPTAHLIAALEGAGFELIHLYGLTESYGPATLCATPAELAGASAQIKAQRLARQGLPHMTAGNVKVVDVDGKEVPWDGASIGEIHMAGNTLMAGYYRDDAATEQAFAGGWFHTGDLAVRHPDGQVEIRDRAKDIIVSGGENIASLEIESVLQTHPAVLFAAVVPMKHEKWGEVPCAFIELKPGTTGVSAEELQMFCRERLAHFKVPRQFIYSEIPKTASGKIQKYLLRSRMGAVGEAPAGAK